MNNLKRFHICKTKDFWSFLNKFIDLLAGTLAHEIKVGEEIIVSFEELLFIFFQMRIWFRKM